MQIQRPNTKHIDAHDFMRSKHRVFVLLSIELNSAGSLTSPKQLVRYSSKDAQLFCATYHLQHTTRSSKGVILQPLSAKCLEFYYMKWLDIM